MLLLSGHGPCHRDHGKTKCSCQRHTSLTHIYFIHAGPEPGCANIFLFYTGVGNTVFRTIGSHATRLYSTEGVIGSRMRQPPLQTVPLNRSDIILLYSDGVSDRFDVEHYPQILYHSARAIARKVVDKFGKSHDDATCIVMRYGR